MLVGLGQWRQYSVALRVDEISDSIATGTFQTRAFDREFGKSRRRERDNRGGEPRRQDNAHLFVIFVTVDYQRIGAWIGVVGVVSALSDPVDFAPPQPILGFLFGNIHQENFSRYRRATLLNGH